MSIDVSIVVPLHNAEVHLPQTFALLQDQASASVEFVLVDDHSTDNTLQIVRGWIGHLPNLTVLTASGRGVASARNQAVARATGTYLWFTDCDDTWSATIATDMLAMALDTDADIVVCNAIKVLPDGPGATIDDALALETVTGEVSLRRLFRGELQGHLWNKLFKRDLFEAVAFPPTRAHSDLGAMFGLLASSTKVAFLPKQLYNYFIHEGSILNGREYRWEDLPDCLALAKQAAEKVNSDAGARGDFTIFKYQNIYVPLANESVRREQWTDAAAIRRVRKIIREGINFSDVPRIALAGRLPLAARVLLLKAAPQIYNFVYRIHRKRIWSALDTGSNKSAR